MRRKINEASTSRIRHSLTLPELLVRLFVCGVCLSGLGIASVHFYDALSLRIKQRALVASVNEQDNAQDPASDSKSSDSNNAGSITSVAAVDPSVIASEKSRIPEDALPEFQRTGQGSLPVTQERQARAPDKSESEMPGSDEESPLNSELGSNEKLVTADQRSREQDSKMIPELEQTPDEFVLPKFEIQDLSSGRSYDPLEIDKGKVIVLDFWASWCAPCLEEMQLLQNTFGKYDADRFQLIAVNTEESKTVIEEVIETQQINSRVALDLDGSAAAVFGVESLPTLVLIDQAGTVQRIHVGLEKGLSETIQGEVDRLLSGQRLSVSEDVESRLFLANMKTSERDTVST